MADLIFAYAVVFAMALIFMVLMVVRKSKYFTPLWASLSMVFWFALGGLHLIVFAGELSFLGYLWFAVGIVCEIVGFVVTALTMKADQEESELTL